MSPKSLNSSVLVGICLAFFACFIQQVESHENRYNTTNPIESPRQLFFRGSDETCAKLVREDDAKCYQVYSRAHNSFDEKSYCCYYFSMYNCLEEAIKKKCDLQSFTNFKANAVFEATTQFVTSMDCPNYQTYEACQFPLRNILIISGSAILILFILLALVLYRHYRTGFHRVAANDV